MASASGLGNGDENARREYEKRHRPHRFGRQLARPHGEEPASPFMHCPRKKVDRRYSWVFAQQKKKADGAAPLSDSAELSESLSESCLDHCRPSLGFRGKPAHGRPRPGGCPASEVKILKGRRTPTPGARWSTRRFSRGPTRPSCANVRRDSAGHSRQAPLPTAFPIRRSP